MSTTTQKQYEQEVLLLIERDIPMIQNDISDIKDDLKSLKTAHDSDRKEMTIAVTQIGNLSSMMTEIKQTLSEKKEEMPWWRNFQQILIMILVLGIMVLAGVKGADALLNKVIEPATISASNTSNNP